MAEPGAPPPAAAAEPAAPPSDAAGPDDKQRRNRIKKLKSQYLSILELEQRAAAGRALDAGQADKLARKAAVAAELSELGAALPELPPPPAAGAGGGPGGGVDMEQEVSQDEVTAALDALLSGGGGGSRRQPAGPVSPALQHQLRLQEQNPGYSYFITLPEPLPDIGVKLQDTVGAIFFETMRPRAEAGQPRAVRMMYDQLLPSAQQAGVPAMQLRLQLLAEYGVDPITEQAVQGSDEEKLAWLQGVVPAAEAAAAERQLEQTALRMAMAERGGGGGRGGRQRRRR